MQNEENKSPAYAREGWTSDTEKDEAIGNLSRAVWQPKLSL
jgi:hypothetical protein